MIIKGKRIAILGATSHIAKGLINNFLDDENFVLHLFSRSPKRIYDFFKSINRELGKNNIVHKNYGDFLKHSYDAIINCVGIGTLRNHGDFSDYFFVNEKFDNLCIWYLQKINPKATYVSFSSGAIYGRDFSLPAQGDTANNILVNNIQKEDYYAIMRINSEAKHRSLSHLNIVDLRVFSYFSRFIDMTDGYFITDILDCILRKKILYTDKSDMVRDYLHPDDLFQAIKLCLGTKKINSAFDLMSRMPIKKKVVLDYFSQQYSLKYEFRKSARKSPTGGKNNYYSRYKKALQFGYRPRFNSLEVIKEESKYILGE